MSDLYLGYQEWYEQFRMCDLVSGGNGKDSSFGDSEEPSPEDSSVCVAILIASYVSSSATTSAFEDLEWVVVLNESKLYTCAL